MPLQLTASHRSLGKRWSLLGYSTSKKVEPKAGHWERISMYFCWEKDVETPYIWRDGGVEGWWRGSVGVKETREMNKDK